MAMKLRRSARSHDQTAIRRSRKGGDGALDLVGVAHVDWADLHPEQWCHRLDDGKQARSRTQGGIPQDSGSRHAWRDLFEQLQPFSANAVFEFHETGGVPPGRARLSTKPAPTGSPAIGNTIGTA